MSTEDYGSSYWTNILSRDKAKELGCTCEWWGRGSIIVFDDGCPVIDRHHRKTADHSEIAAKER